MTNLSLKSIQLLILQLFFRYFFLLFLFLFCHPSASIPCSVYYDPFLVAAAQQVQAQQAAAANSMQAAQVDPNNYRLQVSWTTSIFLAFSYTFWLLDLHVYSFSFGCSWFFELFSNTGRYSLMGKSFRVMHFMKIQENLYCYSIRKSNKVSRDTSLFFIYKSDAVRTIQTTHIRVWARVMSVSFYCITIHLLPTILTARGMNTRPQPPYGVIDRIVFCMKRESVSGDRTQSKLWDEIKRKTYFSHRNSREKNRCRGEKRKNCRNFHFVFAYYFVELRSFCSRHAKIFGWFDCFNHEVSLNFISLFLCTNMIFLVNIWSCFSNEIPMNCIRFVERNVRWKSACEIGNGRLKL